ncbi:MAG: DUF4886 domain-containing protein [Bacteroidetes bacterium]|nr:MAG: DUF4886 domain-containing protein [Bacteroidota bacterium]
MQRYLLLCLLAMKTLSMSAQAETSVLFIGNSFTFMNDMPFTFQAIAQSKGKSIFVDTVVEGGKNFEYHASQQETFDKIKSRKWDFVVIQGHSNELAQPDSKVDRKTFPYAQKLVDSIRANSSCTQIVLYMTWGYKYGNHRWNPIATYDSMQLRIHNQYLRFADLLNARVSPVGAVWKSIRDQYSGINLYDPDNHHPSPEGSYVSACTFFASIFGESPIDNSAKSPLDAFTRQVIEMNASQIVLNQLNKWRFVPHQDEMEIAFDLVLQNKLLQTFNRSSNYVVCEWQFGDGHLSTEKSPSHTYEKEGSYEVQLTLSNSCKSISLQRSIKVQ